MWDPAENELSEIAPARISNLFSKFARRQKSVSRHARAIQRRLEFRIRWLWPGLEKRGRGKFQGLKLRKIEISGFSNPFKYCWVKSRSNPT